MAQVNRSIVTLRIAGDDLIPSEISKLLNCEPTYEQTKGEVVVGKKSGKERIVKIGMWRLAAEEFEPENLNAQIAELLSKLPKELELWKLLSAKYEIDLFCGLFMEQGNEGLEISPLSLKLLGERGIQLSLDIYDGNDKKPNLFEPCPCSSGKTYGTCCMK